MYHVLVFGRPPCRLQHSQYGKYDVVMRHGIITQLIKGVKIGVLPSVLMVYSGVLVEGEAGGEAVPSLAGDP